MFEDKDYPVKRGDDGEFKVRRHGMFNNGDIFTEVEGWKYPYRGFPIDRWVDMIGSIKSIIPAFSFFIKYSNKFSLIFNKKAIERFMEGIIEGYGKTIMNSEGRPLTKRYCKAVRELNRAIESYLVKVSGKNNIYEVEKSKNEFGVRFIQAKYIICTILEWDNAYRYRFQDIIQLLDKFAFLKNPRKEMNRLFGILIERENYENTKEQWRKIHKMLNMFLLVAPILFRKYLKIIKEIVLELNLEELKFEIDDEYWCDIRKDYNFRGIDHRVYAEDKKVD